MFSLSRKKLLFSMTLLKGEFTNTKLQLEIESYLKSCKFVGS